MTAAEERKAAAEAKRQKVGLQQQPKKRIAKKAPVISTSATPDTQDDDEDATPDTQDDDDTTCEECNMVWLEDDDEPWVSCRSCSRWYHEECTRWRGNMNKFICSSCMDKYHYDSESDSD
ncbi:PHD finger protein ALFIN-LIKE 5-like [Strongylocentrotus purpuratus]|uniref:Zinc finger PHD-type domain-containing protein n=1 Tax=Strongylocentrotus purpuratus TaxID=7668 RepID=A0A7M7LTW0_STRPU|nr:PHD finger protein ALFIN-LIKE 5-like [Strongylocentrotus purpuratus]|eukprot:XP_011680911.1 PREDICTED: PHD finger protein ALFIN-LIKE 5-like [Strongylocentrotus purpuratus]